MTFSKILIVLGLGIIVLGLALDFSPDFFSWFGRLPGDIRISGRNGFIFFPFTSMIVICVVLSILFSLLSK